MIARLLLFLALALTPDMAAADCDTANEYVFNFSDQAAATLAYGSRYTYSARNGAGATQTFTVDLAQNGLTSTAVNARTMPEIGTLVTGANAALRTLTLGGIFGGRTTSVAGSTRVITMTMTFAQPVRDVTLTVHDVDYTVNQFRDWIQVTGSAAGTPLVTTPWGTSNATGAARSSTSSSVLLGTSTSPVAVAVSDAAGTGTSDNNSGTGNVTVSFAQPVTSVTLRYGNYPYQSGENTTGQQAMGISGVWYCPLPRVTITKSSAPYDTAGTTRFAIPGADVLYTFVLTNSGGSVVDASTLVITDILPAGVTLFGGDVDGTGPATGPFEFTPGTSGLTLPNAGIAYSSNGGTTWTYQAGSSYDASVRGVRLTPSGSLAANSSATIRFRARVN